MRNKSVVENHDKLFVQNILGVPTNPGETNATLMSWFGNWAHRVDGGTLHIRNMRFGGEGGGYDGDAFSICRASVSLT